MIAVPQIHVFRLEDFSVVKDLQLTTENYFQIIFKKNSDSTNLFFGKSAKSIAIKVSETGCVCLFSRSFFTKIITDKLDELFSHYEGRSVYTLDKKQELLLDSIFTKMLSELNSHYTYKDDLLRNYISEITHIAIKSSVAKISV